MEATGIRLIEYKRRDATFSIYNVADIHYGSRGCAKDRLYKDIAKIHNDPYALFAVGGDYLEAIMPGDKRFDPEAVDADIRVNDLSTLLAMLTHSLEKLFLPIAPKCLGWCYGNHEYKHYAKESQRMVHTALCDGLNVPNMNYSGWADLYFKHNPRLGREVRMSTPLEPPAEYAAKLRVLIHHGFGASATPGGKMNALIRLVNITHDTDLVMTGHLHEQMAKLNVRLSPNTDCSEIKQRQTMVLMTGSYLRTYSPGYTSYGEMRGYQPTTLGATRATYSPSEKRLVVEIGADGVG